MFFGVVKEKVKHESKEVEEHNVKEILAKVLHRKKGRSHIGHFLILDFIQFSKDIYTSST